MKSTWKAYEEHGKLSSEERKDLPDSVYAFPTKRKEPLVDASHVREALARFDQVKHVTDEERDQAFTNIQAAARHYKIDIQETNWHELGKKPHTRNTAHKG